MTAIERVIRTQRVLGAAAIAQALGWGIASALLIIAAISFGSLVDPALRRYENSSSIIAVVAGLLVAAGLLWRSRHFTSRNKVALWIEERIPALHYSLITAIEHASSPFARGMEAEVERQNVGKMTIRSLRRTTYPALGALVAAGLLLYVSPSAAFGRNGLFSRLGGARSSSAVPPGSRLERLEVRVTPPAYTRQRATTLEDPASVHALVGSRIVIEGQGSPDGIASSLPGSAQDVRDTHDGWSVSLTMPPRPLPLTLTDREHERIIVLDPRADAPPKITLTSPLRDSTLRSAQMVVQLNANASDDIGLRGAYFEYLITSGSGEIFNARTVNTPVVAFDGSRSGAITATLDLGSLKLNQGDVVSIRAITQDGNTLSGPGIATSDTRTFRIARADEYDSVAVDAAGPLPVDTAAMSQRVLIAMTEKLVKEMKRIPRAELVRRSGQIGDLEDKIRKRVEEILYQSEGGEEGEEAAGGAPSDPAQSEEHAHEEVQQVRNSDLFEAFNALWAAVRSLQIAEPDSALPPMRVALKALDRARLANRLYLRGIPPKVIVDVPRVRMSGKEKGAASIRTPRSAADSVRVNLEKRFNDAVEMISSKPAEAIRAFTLIQVEAIPVSTHVATALGDAIDAFRKGRDATLPLLRARRALSGDPSGSSGLPAWTGDW